jgi:hypothetical protein
VRPEAIVAWMQLYAAVGLLAGICAACAVLRTLIEIRSGLIDLPAGTWKQKALWLPSLWLRFQISYLSGFPCIMGIALLYAHYIGFEAFDPS